MANDSTRSEDAEKQGIRQRLSPANRSELLLPWRRAEGLTRCFLYWMPVNSYPIPALQREWLLDFLIRWTEYIKVQMGFRAELFLQYKTIYPDLMDPFLNRMLDFVPIMGLGRRPGESLPDHPSQEEIDRMTKSMFEALQRKERMPMPDSKKYMPDYSYWFLDKSHEEQRKLFFGHGGVTMTFMNPDPKIKPPTVSISPTLRKKIPVLQMFDLEKSMERAASLGDGFQKKSKELFGAGLEGKPQTKGIPFILPLLNTSDFQSQPDEVIRNCFEVFPVYLRESPQEKGILLAFESDLEEGLIQVLKTMKDQKRSYPLS